jgi:hypothetical protein
MTGTVDDEAVTDPVGLVVRLVSAVESSLGTEQIRDVVSRTAGGRAKRRRLARTLAQDPAVLTTGGPPVSWAVGQLLFGLRSAGATSIAAPRCAHCGRTVSYMISQGNLVCSPCRDKPQTCANCGEQRRVSTRDRHGRPRCDRCPDIDDPMPLLERIVTGIDPQLGSQTIRQAVVKSTIRPAGQRRLAWAVVDNPELLTGAGCDAPTPAVLRFINQLIAAGSATVVPPTCARCDRAVSLSKLLDGKRVCRTCFAHHAAVPCAGCGAVREPATRDAQGRPLCPNCLSYDPFNLENCLGCARRRPVAARTPEGPWCQHCRPRETMTCSICGRTRLCEISRATGQPWCDSCQSWSARCSGCGVVNSIRGGTRAKPLCAKCVNPDPDFWDRCPICKETWQINPRRACHRCSLKQRAREILGDGHGNIRDSLAPLEHALIGIERPATAMDWLARPAVAQLLTTLARDERDLSHELLDELPTSKTLDHLRAVLIAEGMLPNRDERLTTLERWVSDVVDSRTDPEERQLLHRYVVWHHMRRLRRRLSGKHQQASRLQALNVRCHATAATRFLDWLASQDLTLASCGQADLERWITSPDVSYKVETSHFIRWAVQHRHAHRLTYGTVRWTGPTGTLNSEKRWEDARKLLNDNTIATSDRVAGLLLLLYAQQLSAVTALTPEHVTTSADGQVTIRLGASPTTLPEPLADLVLELVATRRPHTVIGQPGQSPWLFPGQRPGEHISAERLGERLHALDIRPSQSRSTALFTLATELPAAILARMLGINIKAAVVWQQAASGDWAAYAADVSRRSTGSGRHSDSSNI